MKTTKLIGTVPAEVVHNGTVAGSFAESASVSVGTSDRGTAVVLEVKTLEAVEIGLSISRAEALIAALKAATKQAAANRR